MVESMKILDCGCGPHKIAGAIGVDRFAYRGVDVIWDLDSFPWPFENDEFDEIHFNSSIEHLTDIVKVMEEVYRIGKPSAKVYIHAPHFSSPDCFEDVTHKHHFSLFSFDYFLTTESGSFLKGCKFRTLSRKIEFYPLHDRLRIVPYRIIGVEFLANRFPRLYERFFAFIFQARSIHILLEVEK